MALPDFFPKTDEELNIGDANGPLLVGQSFDRTFSYTSSKAPVWGDFYIKDGSFEGHDVYAYNSTFGTPDPTDAPADGSINYKILRPDSISTIPEPSSMLLLGSALALFGGARRFRRK